MNKKRAIPLTPKKEKRAATLAFLIIAGLFLAATLQTQYTPVEFLLNMETSGALSLWTCSPQKLRIGKPLA